MSELELSDFWPTYLACWFILTICHFWRSMSSKFKVTGWKMFLVGYLFTVLNSGLFGHNRVSEQLLSSYWLFQLVCRVLCIRTTFVRRILRGWHSAPCCALGRYWRAFLKSHHACDIVNISENILQYLTTYWAEIVTHSNAPYRYQILDFMRHTTASFVKQTTGRGFVHMFTFFIHTCW